MEGGEREGGQDGNGRRETRGVPEAAPLCVQPQRSRDCWLNFKGLVESFTGGFTLSRTDDPVAASSRERAGSPRPCGD